jgi:hypothetical protein
VVFIDIVKDADVRVGKSRDDPILAPKASDRLIVGGERLGKHLDGDVSFEPRIVCNVDFAHPAGA